MNNLVISLTIDTNIELYTHIINLILINKISFNFDSDYFVITIYS